MVALVRRLEKPGTLVSRSDSDQLRSDYVLLEPGKEVGKHKTEGGEELIVMVDGEAIVISDGHAETVEAPCVVLIPARTVHKVKNRSKTLLRYLYVVVAANRGRRRYRGRDICRSCRLSNQAHLRKLHLSCRLLGTVIPSMLEDVTPQVAFRA